MPLDSVDDQAGLLSLNTDFTQSSSGGFLTGYRNSENTMMTGVGRTGGARTTCPTLEANRTGLAKLSNNQLAMVTQSGGDPVQIKVFDSNLSATAVYSVDFATSGYSANLVADGTDFYVSSMATPGVDDTWRVQQYSVSGATFAATGFSYQTPVAHACGRPNTLLFDKNNGRKQFLTGTYSSTGTGYGVCTTSYTNPVPTLTYPNPTSYGYGMAIADNGATLVYSGPNGNDGSINIYFWNLATTLVSTLHNAGLGVVTINSITGAGTTGWTYTKHALIDSSGRLVLIGLNSLNKNGFIARFILGPTSTTLDTSFNSTGVKLLNSLSQLSEYVDVMPHHIVEDSSGNYVIVGHAKTSASDTTSDGWILRINSAGAGP